MNWRLQGDFLFGSRSVFSDASTGEFVCISGGSDNLTVNSSGNTGWTASPRPSLIALVQSPRPKIAALISRSLSSRKYHKNGMQKIAIIHAARELASPTAESCSCVNSTRA